MSAAWEVSMDNTTNTPTREQLLCEIESLRARLEIAESTLDAIRSGEADALSAVGAANSQESAEYPYRVLIEQMSEGAATLSTEGTILYCNQRLAAMLKSPLEKLIGTHIGQWLPPEEQPIFQEMLTTSQHLGGRIEIILQQADGSSLPAYISSNTATVGSMETIGLVVMELTEQRQREAMLQGLLEEAKQSRLALLNLVEDQQSLADHLRQSETRFRTLFNSLPMGGVIYRLIRDENKQIIEWEVQDINPIGAQEIQQKPADVLGRRASELFGQEMMQFYIELSREVVAAKQPRYIETHFDHNDQDYLAALVPLGTEQHQHHRQKTRRRKGSPSAAADERPEPD
jgi:PAS domain S-box-containing protein